MPVNITINNKKKKKKSPNRITKYDDADRIAKSMHDDINKFVNETR